MDAEARKAEIRRRLTLARYPRKSEAKFTDDNDHNPTVLLDCPNCYGSGKASDYAVIDGVQHQALVACDACGGLGVTGEIGPCFQHDSTPVEARADAKGWVTCPGCLWRFAMHDAKAWTGRRHLRCGQKIIVIPEQSS